MKKSRWVLVGVIPCTILALIAFAFAEAPDKEDEEEAIAVGLLPAAVAKTASGFFGTLEGLTAQKEVKEGVNWFELKGTKSGVETEIKLTEGGELVEIEQAISISALPAAAQRELKKDFPSGEFLEVQSVELHFYEVKVKTKQGTKEVRVFASGDIEDTEEEGEE